MQGDWARAGRARPPPAEGHRPHRRRRPADGRRRRSGLTIVFNGCIYNHRELRRRARAGGLRVLLHQRHRGDPQGLRPLGDALRRAARSGCSRSRSASTAAAGWSSPATGSASSRSTSPAPGSPAVRLDAARRCWPAAGSTPSLDPVALHHYFSWHAVVPAPRTILQRGAQAAAGDGDGDRARRDQRAPSATGAPSSSRPPEHAELGRGTSGRRRCSTRCGSRSSGGWWPTCRSACCSPAGSTRA